MKRFIAQFVRGGFPELYAVADTEERCIVSDPMPYHAANDRARDMNQEPKPADDWAPMTNWLGGLNLPTQP